MIPLGIENGDGNLEKNPLQQTILGMKLKEVKNKRNFKVFCDAIFAFGKALGHKVIVNEGC